MCWQGYRGPKLWRNAHLSFKYCYVQIGPQEANRYMTYNLVHSFWFAETSQLSTRSLPWLEDCRKPCTRLIVAPPKYSFLFILHSEIMDVLRTIPSTTASQPLWLYFCMRWRTNVDGASSRPMRLKLIYHFTIPHFQSDVESCFPINVFGIDELSYAVDFE